MTLLIHVICTHELSLTSTSYPVCVSLASSYITRDKRQKYKSRTLLCKSSFIIIFINKKKPI